jgi:DNA replication and repair protein RecF
MAVQGQPDGAILSPTGQYRAGKRLRVNGAAKRASEAIGQINAVFFTPQDLDLVGGPPSLRRRYIDVTLSQVDRRYLVSLQKYGKVLLQRNALLRRIRDGAAEGDQLAFWDAQMAEAGAYIVGARARTLARVAGLAREAQASLSGEREELALVYEPHWARDFDAERAAGAGEAELATAYVEALLQGRRREIAAGASLWGPHRDDLLFLLDGRSAAAFASRAQRRTAALALRVAEARFLLAATGDYPVLLLDDVLSEMDEGRRRGVLDAIAGFDQVWITSAEREEEGQASVPGARIYRVKQGQVTLE